MSHPPAPPISRGLSLLASVLAPLGRWPGALLGMRFFCRLSAPRRIRVRQGAYTLSLDSRDYYQVCMALRQYDPTTCRLFSRILRPGDVYLDVGAQLGYMAAWAGNLVGPRGWILLFEPDPRVYGRLEETMASADPGRTPRVTLSRLACSDASASREFHLSSIIGQSSLQAIGNAVPEAPPVEVRTDTLDNQLCQLGAGRIRLMKMDIEGHELWALRGMAETFASDQVDTVLIEKSLPAIYNNGLEPHHLHAFFAAHHYVGAHEDGRPITRASLEQGDLENLCYARSLPLLKSIFPRLDAARLNEGYAPGELAQYYEEIRAAHHPGLRRRRIIRDASLGRLKEAIDEGARFLGENPHDDVFRGHFAYWLCCLGRREEALKEFLLIVAKNPANLEARQYVERIRQSI